MFQSHDGLNLEEISFGPDSKNPDQEIDWVGPSGASPLPPAADLEPAGGVTAHPGESAEEDARARVAGNLAMGLARILVSAIQDLEVNSGHYRNLAGALREQENRLDDATERLLGVNRMIDALTETVSENKSAARKDYQEVLAGIASLREADGQHQSAVEQLRKETRELSASLTDRLEALGARLQTQHEEMASWRPKLSEISPRVAFVVERLDRQAEAIRALCQAGVQREATLDQLADMVSRLKSSWLPTTSIDMTDL